MVEDRTPLSEFDGDDDPNDGLIDDDGDELPEETLAELAAIAAAEAEAAEAAAVTTDSDRGQAHRDLESRFEAQLESERAARRAAVARYREAVLASEPELPPELVRGDSLEELDASLDAARRAVAQIRERLMVESEQRGFPAGSPERRGPTTEGLSAAEKIAYGLERQAR